MKQLFKKCSRLSCICILSFLLISLLLLFVSFQRLGFQRFTKTLFQEEMKSDTLSMHYILANPQAYGIPENHVSLLPYSPQAEKQQSRQVAVYSNTLSSLHPLFWKKDSKLLHTLLQESFSIRMESQRFSYYAEPLSPGSGIPSNLPILLAEYTFRSEQDVKNYLTLLSQIPAYLDSLALYESEKSLAGLFMSDSTADKVIRQCYEIMDSHKLMNHTHFLNTTFSQRLKPLVNQQLISAKKATAYEKQNHLLLLEQIMPAYESLGDTLSTLKGTGKNQMGLAYLPKGRSYYKLLLKDTTGCHRSITDIKQLLVSKLKADSQALTAVVKASPRLLSVDWKNNFPPMTPEQYLVDLQKRMATDFPPLPQSDIVPAHTVKKVSKSLENFCSPAFYLTPPIDDISENSIYINQKDNPSPLELYTTLAHEGYPGHLYQTVYYQLYQQNEQVNPARNLLHYGGYSEGWALYVEMLSYDYAQELLHENDASQDTLSLIEALRLNRSIQLCLYSLLDILIHYDGATLSSVQEYLKEFGITDSSVANDIYEYIVEEPANYPKYYLGYLEFEMLKESAQQKWGDSYTNMRFHKLILETGPCPFHILWKYFS